jgi:hypothetical protein
MHVVHPQEKNIQHTGNLAFDDIIEIARAMRHRSCAKDLTGSVKEILGTCVSVGCTVDHEDPREIQEKVRGTHISHISHRHRRVQLSVALAVLTAVVQHQLMHALIHALLGALLLLCAGRCRRV